MKLVVIALTAMIFFNGCSIIGPSREQLILDIAPALLEPPEEFKKLKEVEPDDVAGNPVLIYNG